MPFADLLRRSSTRAAVDTPTPLASTSYHGSTSNATSSKPRSSPAARERFTFGRTKTRTSVDADRNLLYPTRQIQTGYSSNRGSYYSSTDDHSIGEAPSHVHNLTAPSSKRPPPSVSPSRSPLPHSQSSPSSLATTSQLNQHERLFGLADSTASVSPSRLPATLANPLTSVPASSPVRSIPLFSAPQQTESPSKSDTTDQPMSAAASSSTTLLRSKSTKSKSIYPPAASSTGTSSSLRDRTTMGSAILRRPSFSRRTGSNDSSALRSEKLLQGPSPALPVKLKPTSSNLSSTTVAPATTAESNPVSPSNSAAAIQSSSSGGRFARLFGRKKSNSNPVNVVHLQKPHLTADPVPALQDANFSVNKQSPPLAVISAECHDSKGFAKAGQALLEMDRPVSPRTVSHAHVAPSVDKTSHDSTTINEPLSTSAQLSGDMASGSGMLNGESKVSAFTFPARASLSNDSAQKEHTTADSLRSRQSKHSTSWSLPLTSLPTSNRIPLSASVDSPDASAIVIPPRRPSKLGRSLSHRKNSKSLSVLGSIFGASGSQVRSATSSPPLPQASATLSQRYACAEDRTSHTVEPSASNHSRRPSLRSRLKIGRNPADQGPQCPTTPEIESWKQKTNEPVHGASAETGRRSQASTDSPFRPRPAKVPVKITRSKSMIRRKPPPEIKQDEIDSSSSTPVYSRTVQSLEVDQQGKSPLGGSPASSPEAQFLALAGSSPKLLSHAPAPASSSDLELHDAQLKPIGSESSHANGLGLIGAFAAYAENANHLVPSIDVRPSTQSRDASPIVAIDSAEATRGQTMQKLAAAASPSMHGKRLSSGMHSITDIPLSVDRPWSLISASEADTPLLKLRKLVVNTDASDESRDEDGVNDRLFFRPLTGAGRSANEAEVVEQQAALLSAKMIDATVQAEVMSEGESEQLRSSSQTTTRSDIKHEVVSVHSSGSGALCAARSVAAQPSVSGLSAVSGALSEASQTCTIQMRHVPANLAQTGASTSAAPVDIANREADSVGPLPAKSPALSQHSFRTRQHRRDGSTGSVYSQSMTQQARRASTASRITARSSGHWSESRLSEDALSALEAEVGQARRAEVVALGKGRVKDWVGGGGADRPLPTAEAPTLSRSNTLRKKAQQGSSAAKTGDAGEVWIDEKEVQRQKTLNEHLGRKLQQLSDAQVEADASVDGNAANTCQAASAETRSVAPRFARLSAFHDRSLMADLQPVAPQSVPSVATPSSQMVEEAIRLGRAPSKRVRRNVSEASSLGEAVMVEREPAMIAPRRASGAGGGASLAAARHRLKSNSLSAKVSSTVDVLNPTLVPAIPTAPLNLRDVVGSIEGESRPQRESEGSDSKQQSRQRHFATSEEAARAKQQELVERERRHAEKEAKRQAQLQQKYAKKKQNDPLLAARLALAGLQPPEAAPKLRAEELCSKASESAAAFKTSMFGAGLQVPDVPEQRASASPGMLSAAPLPVVRKNSVSGSVTSFHTALDVPAVEVAAVCTSTLAKTAAAALDEQLNEAVGDASFTSKGSGEMRPDTSHSIASSLAVDFEFPVPPQRIKEQLSEDGTLLSRAGLQESPMEQHRQERRHYLAGAQRVRTPPRDSSLRHRTDSSSKRTTCATSLFSNDDGVRGMVESRMMPKLASVSSLDFVKQSVALRRSRSVGYNSCDLRRMTRKQTLHDVGSHPNPKGLGIELEEANTGLRFSNASGSATPVAMYATQTQSIAA